MVYLSPIVPTYLSIHRADIPFITRLSWFADFRTSRDLDQTVLKLLLRFPDPPCLSLGMLLHSFYVPRSHPSVITRASWLTGRLVEQTPLILQPARDRKTPSFDRRWAP